MSSSSSKKEQDIEERVAPPGEVVYEAISREGEHELKRSLGALGLSGLSAGLSMGFSFLAEGTLRSLLPEAPWAPAVAKFGYAFGFVIVILGRQQLFTKNTLTVILPLLEHHGNKRPARVTDVARLWLVVLTANLIGAMVFALLMAWPALFPLEVRQAFSQIAAESVPVGMWAMLGRGVLAGWLIALMIWLLPFAETARVWVIVFLAYLVGIAHLPHVIAGTVPAFYSVLTGQSSLAHFGVGFLLPTLLGNVIGGVALVAVGAHAEFVHEGKQKAG
jgi:formate/nitrite transporter FocA (FNT family)